jgi:hypothetical protein
MALQPFPGPWPLFSFLILCTVARLLGRGISPSQGRYLHIEQHKHRINAKDNHAFSGIRTHDPTVRENEALDRGTTVINNISVLILFLFSSPPEVSIGVTIIMWL